METVGWSSEKDVKFFKYWWIWILPKPYRLTSFGQISLTIPALHTSFFLQNPKLSLPGFIYVTPIMPCGTHFPSQRCLAEWVENRVSPASLGTTWGLVTRQNLIHLVWAGSEFLHCYQAPRGSPCGWSEAMLWVVSGQGVECDLQTDKPRLKFYSSLNNICNLKLFTAQFS